jgi:hypothetical protein
VWRLVEWPIVRHNARGQVRRAEGVQYATETESRRRLYHACSVIQLSSCPQPHNPQQQQADRNGGVSRPVEPAVLPV